MFEMTHDEPTKTLTLKFTGRMGVRESDALRDEFASRLSEIFGPDWDAESAELQIVFDMTDVEYICSGYIRFCVTTVKRFKKSGLRIVNCQEMVKHTFVVGRLTDFLSVG